MSPLADWYKARSRREQLMLGVMALVAVPVIGWFLMIAPALGWHDKARDTYLDATERYGRAVLLADRLEGGGANGVRITQPLGDFVAASAAQAGFALTRNIPDGDARVDIGIAQARPDAVLGWIAQLRAAGVGVESVRLTDNGEGGVAVDLVIIKANR
ncbi:type II secretion system protein GspM [Sphingomicrobium aestuariivivum]|uniref:type II secretion system protein GspM n=1 Tax=Sphingomicrobium aestuariivivum TaxID=1582356 RepID=UPI001FD65D8B|nr:type II secretion system protein GspM [Sphingomicrobium aestuariivivum]MCJ8191264.1 type II secretion system protein M [Sphingomicrobium aestuariivivum]